MIQLLFVACRIYPVMTGAKAPPKLPIMFIEPESVPAYLPPISMQAPQLPGITRSLEKLANPMKREAITGSLICPERKSIADAEQKPRIPKKRRVLATLPILRATMGEIQPPKKEPMPPKKRGSPARMAALCGSR